MKLQELITTKYGKKIAECSTQELYVALLEATKEMAAEKVSNDGKRKVYCENGQ